MTAITSGAPTTLELVPVSCCVCGADDPEPVAVGEDFEYRTSDDTFLAVRCRHCSLLYLNPRPAQSEFSRIYPPTYHAFAFTAERFGFVYRVRRRLEAQRLLRFAHGLRRDACVLDVGCGDGFHLDVLREFGPDTYRLVGVDADPRAVARARTRGLDVRSGTLDEAGLEAGSVDLAILIQTIEHVGDPPALLGSIRRVLRPDGRLIVVTDNAASYDARAFGKRYWGGYHFPRHWNLFTRTTLSRLARNNGLAVRRIETIVSPVNWVYSVRNALVDAHAPRWLVESFSLESTLSLAAFTLLDMLLRRLGNGALLCATLARAADLS